MNKVNTQSMSASGRRAPLAIAAASATALLLSSPLFAASEAWSTVPASNAFGGINWTPGTVAGAASAPILTGDSLYFGASTINFLNNDLSGYSFAGLTFNSGAATYTIAGNAFTLTGNLVNNSTAAQSIVNSITLAQNTTITANTGSILLGSSINGGAFSLTKTGTGLLTLGASNTYSGGTSITGVVNAAVNGALGSGAVTINAGAGNELQLGNGVTFSNAVTANGGGAVAQGVIFVPTGNATFSGTLNVTAATNAGGVFATGNTQSVLTIVGDNTITSSAPVTVRNGVVVYAGAQNYTTGTVLANAGAAIQFSKLVSMPASGTVALTTGTTAIVNAGGTGEFTDGSGTTTAGTIGGLLGGIGGQGAPVTFAAGSSVGIDTRNATAPVTYTSPFTTSATAANNAGLLKLGAGTLALANGGTLVGAGVGGFPLIVRQGTLNLTGGTLAVTGETVIGGNYGSNAGDAGYDATIKVDAGSLTTTTYMSIGRGNGVGTTTASLILNNTATASSSDFALGYNAGNGLNLPKGAVTLNGTSVYTLTGNNFNLAESPGSTGTFTLNNSAQLNATAAGSTIHIGQNGNGTMILNDTSSFTTANNNFGFYVGRVAGSTGLLQLNGSSTVTQQGAAGAVVVGDGGRGLVNIASSTATLSTPAVLIGHFGTTNGAVYNKGTLANITNGVFIGDGVGGYGYLLNDNGAAAVPNGVAGNIVAGITSNSAGVVDVVSGTLAGVRIGGGFYQGGTTTSGQYNVLGGTLSAGAVGIQVGDGVAGAKFVNINVAGGTLASTGPINLGVANNAGSVGVLSVTGGTVLADTITAAGTTSTNIVNFNGGTLKADPAGTTASLITANINRVQLNAGGATIDTNGTTKSVDAVIADPAGQGITGVSLSATGTGYLGRPLVKITDSTGTGATGYANWDPVTGQVTGVTITSPGSNYTQPAVTLIGGGGSAITALPTTDFVAAGGLTKVGTGTLTLTGANTYTGATTVKAGTLRATTPAYTNVLANAGGVDLQSASQFVLDYTGGASPVAQVKAILTAGYAGGFASSQIRSTAHQSGATIGYGDDGTSLVTVRVTLPGDANLSGTVDFNDFLALQANFGQTGTRFDQGNFNYDNVTDFNDFLALQANFGQSITGAAVTVTASQIAAMTAFASAVPEPTSLALLGIGAVGLMKRRRRA